MPYGVTQEKLHTSKWEVETEFFIGAVHAYYGHSDAIHILSVMLAGIGIGYDNANSAIFVFNEEGAIIDLNDSNINVKTNNIINSRYHCTPLKPDKPSIVHLI